MTATSAGSSGCLPAKGLDISLAALQRQDPYINNIMDVASQVALYTYNNRTNEWEKTEVEGTLFIYTRLASPRHGFTIMNRLSMENLTEPITKDLDFQLQHPFLLYRNARLVIHGIWFYDKEDCQRIAQRMKILTQQEQAQAHSQGGWLSPGGGSETKGVDIIQMLTKARTEYDKSTSEPKEIGGSSVLHGKPNLIKPIPVKPSSQDTDSPEPKSLSLATLFGSQHHPSPKSDPVSPLAVPIVESSAGKAARPPVARTLTYEEPANSGRNVTSSARKVAGEDGGNTAGGLLPTPTSAQQQQDQNLNQNQYCPAVQKLMQGQRGVGGHAAVLQTVSESPENRLCDNGVPLDHHHHHLLHHHHQQQHLHHHHQHQQQHHHHHQQQHQQQPDPIKRLLQPQPLPPSSAPFAMPAPLCCPNHPQQSPHAPPQPACSHPVHPSHQAYLSFSKPQPEVQHNSQPAAALQGPGLPIQMPGVVSPHELLQKLQLVQQEQSSASQDPPRPSPGLAPRFLGASPGQGAGPLPNSTAATAGQKAALQFQVISPQRIPATVAPTLLLSPSVFTQTKPGGGLIAVAPDSGPAGSALPRAPLQDETRVLSRSQLQATLLNLIQTDSSFLDTIYEAYVSRLANSSSSKF